METEMEMEVKEVKTTPCTKLWAPFGIYSALGQQTPPGQSLVRMNSLISLE